MQSDDKKEVDLGLSSLLSGGSEGAVATDRAADEAKADITPPSSAADTPPPSEWERLAAAGQWKELLAELEKRLAEEVPTAELRLWWVRASLEADAVSVLMLSAPLSSVSFELVTNREKFLPPFLGRAAETLQLVAARLEQNGERDDAIEFMRRAVALAPQYQGELDAAVARAKSALVSQGVLSSGGEERRQQKLNELSQLSAAAESSVSAALPVGSQPRTREGLSAPMLIGGVALLFVGVAAIGLWFFPGGFVQRAMYGEPVIAAIESSISSAATLRLPNLHAATSAPSALDGLAYDMARGGTTVTRPVTEEAKRDVGGSSSVASASPAASSNGGDGGVKVTAPSRAVINTSTPVEPIEVRDRVTAAPPTREDDTASVLFGSANKPPVGRPAVGNASSRSNERDGASRSNRDQFERYQGRRSFEVAVRTEVYPEPSLRAASVGVLRRGDRVSAEGRQGIWLQIRSSSGRIGWVLKQDVDAVRD